MNDFWRSPDRYPLAARGAADKNCPLLQLPLRPAPQSEPAVLLFLRRKVARGNHLERNYARCAGGAPPASRFHAQRVGNAGGELNCNSPRTRQKWRVRSGDRRGKRPQSTDHCRLRSGDAAHPGPPQSGLWASFVLGPHPEIDQASVMNKESFWIAQTVSNWVPPRVLWPVQAVPAESRMRLARGRSRISLSAQARWPFSSAMRSCRISISTWGIFRGSP